MNIAKDDMVAVIAGDDRGKRGKVLRVFREKRRATVEGVNFIVRHTRANPSKQQQGGRLEKEAPVDMSNLMLICPRCESPRRFGIKRLEGGQKARACQRCGEMLTK
jgi:large subunit ribosomal protein L24